MKIQSWADFKKSKKGFQAMVTPITDKKKSKKGFQAMVVPITNPKKIRKGVPGYGNANYHNNNP